MTAKLARAANSGASFTLASVLCNLKHLLALLATQVGAVLHVFPLITQKRALTPELTLRER